MKLDRKVAIAAGLLLVLLIAFGAVASPPPLPSSFYGTIGASGFTVPAGTKVSAWVGGVKFAEVPVFSADGATAFVIDVPGDIPETAAVEGGREGETIVFKVGGAPAPQTAVWHTGNYERRDLTVAAGADLSVSVDDGQETAVPGTLLTYTLTVRNLGSQMAKGVILTDTLPSTVTADTVDGGTLQGTTITWPAFDLAAGASSTRTVTVLVNTTLPVETVAIVNGASVAHDGSQGLDPNPANDSDQDSDEVFRAPDFVITDSDLTVTPAQPAPGAQVNVSLTVRNTGFKDATGQVVIYNGRPYSGTVVGTRTVTLAKQGSQTVNLSFTAGASMVLVSAAVDPDDVVDEVSEGNNTARKFLADVADLAIGIDNFLLTPTTARAGDAVAIKVTVRNGGRLLASNVPVEVFDGEPGFGGVSIASTTIPSILPGGNQTVSFSWTATEGDHQLTAVVDRADTILEMSETNNQAARDLRVPRAAGPDLTVPSVDVSGLTQSPVTLVAGGTVRATIANTGDAPAGAPFAARLFEDRDGNGLFSAGDRELARQEMPAGLAAGGSATAVFSVQGALEFHHPVLWVEADADGAVAELKEDNNLGACFGNCEPPVPPSPGVVPVEEWYLGGMEIESAPMVAQLSDDNGDGRIDSRDVPDVVFIGEDSAGPAVMARSGVDGTEVWTYRGAAPDLLSSRLAHVATADIDGDGVAEVLAAARNGKLLAIDHHGQRLWASDPVEGLTFRWMGGPSVADLTGDGVPEIVLGRTVLSNTGRKLAVGTADRGRNYWYYSGFGYPLHGRADDQAHSIVADVDLDGRPEIVAGSTLYRLEGNSPNYQLNVVWERVIPDNLMPDGFTAVANLDDDPQAEIVYVSSGLVIVLNHDGTIAVNYRRVIPFSPLVQPNGWSGPPTIADLDGDGKPEILVAGATELVAMRSNLATYWRAPVFDVDAQTAATVFDLDGDGKPEVMYADQDNFYILNGQTGAVRHSRHITSKTANEYPVVADVDNDGQAEILVPSTTSFNNDDATTRGLHVLGNPGWRGTRPVWNEFSYHGTNVQLDGTVPSPETPSWQAGNTYRVNEGQAARSHPRPNATVGLPRVGAAGSTGAPIKLRVGNGGRGVLPAGTAVVVYAGNPSQNVVAAETKTTKALRPGEWQDLLVNWQRSGPAGAPATAVVDPQGLVEECDETDNSVSFGITETVLPDLAIPAGGITVPASPVGGQLVTVSVKVENRGSAQAAASKVRLYDGLPSLGVRVGEASAPIIGPGANATVPVVWETLGAVGTHVIYAVADGDDTVVELDEANNTGSATATLAAATKPDPSAERLTIDPANPAVGTPVRLALDVANRGAALPAGFVVAFRVNNAEVARVTSADPLAAGGRRTVEYTLQTLSLSGRQQVEARIDPSNAINEQNEANNSQTLTFDLASPGATATISTERVSYASNDTATLTLKVQNTTTAAKDLSVKITIQNASGAVVATVSDQAASYPPGTTTTTYTWGTGATLAGAYAAVAEVAQNGTPPVVIARASSPFSIVGDRSATAQIFADRDRYEATQSAALSGRVRNAGVNQSLTNLQAKVTVTGPTGTVVFTVAQAIALLPPGAEAPVDAVWPIASAAPGVYTVRLEARDNASGGGAGVLLAFASASVTVLDSAQTGAGLSGELMVSPETVGAGGLLLARFSTSNGGNADMSALRLRLRLERIADETTVVSEEIPWPLARNQQRAGSLGLSTAGFQEGEYVAVLEALLPGGEIVLGRETFQVVHGVSVSDARVSEGDSGMAQAVFEVTLSSAATQEVTVGYATADGTALAGQDYEAASGTLTFQPGETRKTVAVNVLGDTVPESEEVFLLTLGNAVGTTLGDGQGLGAIADEEGCPSPNLLADGGAEEGLADSDLPGWTAASGTWKRRFADPVPLDGLASLASGGSRSAELSQDVDLSPYAARIDAGSQELLFEGFVQSLVNDGAQVIVEYRDAAKTSVLASFDSGEIVSAGTWKAVVDARLVPAGTRWARVRLLGVEHGDAGIDAFFDRLGLRSLGVPVLSVTAPSVVEGNTGTQAARFELRLSCPAPAALDVAFATANGTATAGSDYDAASGTVTFAQGEEVKTVNVAVRGDLVDEADETFFLDLTAGTGVVVLDPRSTGSIEDDDGPVVLSVSDGYVDEGDTGTAEARFTVSLPGPSGKTVKVNYATVAGTAVSGTDFTAVSGTLTFAPGVESLEVAVPVKGDRVDEADEMFTLRLSAPVNASIADADGAGTILDNDQAELAIADAAVLEGNGTGVSLVFPVTLSIPADRPVQVSYATVNGTAIAGTDYQAASGTLTIAPGALAGTISVAVLGNTAEQLDRTLLVRLDNPQVAVLTDPEAQGTIRDDDGILINLSADVKVTEGDSGTANAAFTVTVANNNTRTVTVNYSPAAGTAVSPADFTAVTNTLTFPPGTSLRTFNVPVVGDSVEELLAETFEVKLSGASTGTIQRSTATVTVFDNDGWVLNGSTAKLDTVPGCIFLTRTAASSAWKKQQIDLSKSFDQTYQLYLGSLDAGGGGIVFALQSQGLTALGSSGVNLGYSGITPSVGVETDVFQDSGDPVFDHMAVDLNGNTSHQGVAAVQALPNSDNIEDGLKHDLRVVWNATAKVLDVHMDGSERLTYSSNLVAQVFAGNPNVYFGLTGSDGSTNDDRYFCPTVQCADPSQPVQVSIGDARLQEGNTGTSPLVFPVTLSCPSSQPVTVSFATADGTARAGSDYVATSGTLTFQPGETSKDVVVPIPGDLEVEPDETFTVSLSGAANAVIRYAQGTGTLLTEDSAVVAVATQMVEGNFATGDFLFDLVLTSPLTVPVSFNWATADGTALAGSDYATTSGSVTFAAGETRKPITLRVLGDTVQEPDETFKIRFTNVVNGIVPAEMTVTLLDDDDCPTPNLLRDGGGEEALLANGDLPGWTEVLGTNWTRQGFANGSVIFPAAFQGSVFIHPGPPTVPTLNELRQDVDVSSFARNIDDGLQRFAFDSFIRTYPETPPDTARLVLEYRDATNAQVLASTDTGFITSTTGWLRVSDLRTAPLGTRFIRVRLIGQRGTSGDPWADAYFDAMSLVALRMPGLRIEDASLAEGNSGVQTLTFPVTLTCAGTQPITVAYLTADGTATAGSDYQATFGTLTFAPGQTSATVSVPILGDVFTEGNETFSVKLASPVNAGIVRTPATGTILEDESTASIAGTTAAGTAVTEGSSGQVQAVFTVTLSKASNLPVSVDWTTVDGTATAGTDYVAASGTLQFDAGQTSKTISVAVLGDTLVEPDETFLVRLSNPTLVTLGTAEATGTIVQDDLTLSIGDASVIEGNTGTVNATFTVTLSQPSTQAVTFKYSTENRSATAPQDYTAFTDRTGSIPAGATSTTVAVSVNGDTLTETGELFAVILNSPVNATILNGEGIGNIADDDDCPSPNLIRNPGNEETLVNNEIPGWTEAVGTTWGQNGGGLSSATPRTFYAGSVADAELRQDVDVAGYSALIDAGIQRFSFSGWIYIDGRTPNDTARIVLEYRDAANQNVLGTYDSGIPAAKATYVQEAHLSAAPPGTRWIRVRLIAHRTATSGVLAAYFDALELRSLGRTAVSITDGRALEEDNGVEEMTFTLSLSCPWNETVTVDYSTAPETALAGLDYQPVQGTVTFLPGTTQRQITVPVLPDLFDEGVETFRVLLDNPVVGVVADRQAVGSIDDNDPPPTWRVRDAQVLEGHSGTVDAAFVVEVSQPSNSVLTISYRTLNGEAQAGTDYTAASGVLTFQPGEVSKTVLVPVKGDTLDELDETFLFELQSPSEGGLADPLATGLILDDDDTGVCAGPNLLTNAGSEKILAGTEIQDWTELVNTNWTRRTTSPDPQEGFAYFSSPGTSELGQTADLGGYNPVVGQIFAYEGFLRSTGSANFARLILDFLDASGNLMSTTASPEINNSSAWQRVSGSLAAPAGAARVRLRLSCRSTSTSQVCFFDGLSVRSTGTPVLWADDLTMSEGQGQASFRVRLSCPVSGQVTTDFRTADGSALAGSDYQAVSGTVTLPPGSTQAAVTVPMVQDATVEPEEQFFLDLGPVAGASLARPRTPGTVVDDDGPAVDLVLCMDGSGSIDANEFALQLNGLAAALENPQVMPRNSTVRISVIQFDTGITLEVAPTVVTAGNAAELASRVRAIARRGGGTDIGLCIREARNLMIRTVPLSLKQVIDLSTDGEGGDPVSEADIAIATGIDVINAIAIGDGINLNTLNATVRPQPAGGAEGFVVIARDFVEYQAAIAQKIRREISPDLAVTKTDGRDTAVPGQATSYTIKVTNVGAAPVTSLRVTDPLPGILNPSFTASAGTFNPGTGVWSGLNLDNGDAVTLTVAGTIDPARTGTLSNTVTVSPPDGTNDLNPADNTATDITQLLPSADLRITKSHGGELAVGENAVYSLNVANAGPSAAAGPVTVTDSLPPGLVFLSATGTGWTCSAAGSTVTCQHPGPVPAGGALPAIALAVRVGIEAYPAVTNSARVSGTTPDPAPGNDVTSDTAPVAIRATVSVADVAVQEGSGGPSQAVFVLTLSQAVPFAVQVRYATADGSATAGADYAQTSGIISIPAGATTALVAVPVLDDTADEPSETFYLRLTEVTGALLADAEAVATITDDDVPQISIASLSVGEGNAGTVEALLAVRLSAPSFQSVSVDFATALGTAAEGVDYQSASGRVTFGAGETEKTVSVRILGDLLDEADETFLVNLSNPVNAIAGSAGTVTILDDDEAPSVSIASLVVSEGSGTANLTATLSAPSGREIRVDYATADGTAIVGTDYTAATGTLVFQAGTTSQTISVPVTNDALDEADETFLVNLSNPVNATVGSAGTVTITDDDETPSVSIANLSVSESAGTAELTVTLSAASGREIRVDYATADGTAIAGTDYTAATGTLVFPAGTTSQTVSVPVTNDALDEADETFLVNLSNPVNATASSAGTVTITDDDEAPSISIASLSVSEGVGTAELTVTLSAASGREIRVDYATANGTAIAGTDYTAATGTLVFPAGTTSQTVSVPVTNDALDEADETFLVNLSNPVNVTAGSAATVTITDDDGTPTLSISDVTVTEGDSGTVTAELTVTLSAASSLDVTAAYATADGTATAGSDYQAASGTLTIPAGSLTATIQIQVEGDEVDEADETIHVALASPVAATLATPADAEGVITITDDDEEEARAHITVNDVRVTEGNTGTKDAVFAIELADPSDAEARVDYATADGTATAGPDYVAASGTLVFAPGEVRKTVTVKVKGDLLLETDETFTLELDNAVGAVIDDGSGTGTIEDDEDCPGPNLLVNPSAEQGSASAITSWREVVGTDWQVRTSSPSPAEGAGYFYAGTAAFAELAQDVNVAAYAAPVDLGVQTFAFQGKVRSRNENPSDTSRIVVEYRNAANTVVLDAFDTGEIASPLSWQQVADSRPAPVGTRWIRVRLIAGRFQGTTNDGYFDALSLRPLGTPAITISDVTLPEGTSGTRDAVFNVTLSCPVGADVSVAYATADGTAQAGSDYVAASGTLVFPAGSTQQTIAVTVKGDQVNEPTETFKVNLSGAQPSDLAVIADPQGIGTITNGYTCSRSPGYWKNHTSVWPFQSVVMGGVTYNASQMLTFLKYGGSDASIHLARQLLTTRLNLAIGSDTAVVPIAATADAFLVNVPPGSNPQGSLQSQANSIKDQLEAYNDRDCGN